MIMGGAWFYSALVTYALLGLLHSVDTLLVTPHYRSVSQRQKPRLSSSPTFCANFITSATHSRISRPHLGFNLALKSTVERPGAEERTDSDSERLGRARRLLSDFNNDFTAPPQFLLASNPNEPPTELEMVDTEENVVYDGMDIAGATARREVLSTRWDNGVKVATPVLVYSPDLSSNRYLTKPFKWIRRNAEIALPLAKWFSGVVLDVVSGKVEERQQSRANELLKAINSLGPAIIKGGQALASRPDLLPKVYLDELQKLQDDVPRFADDVAFDIVYNELGVHFDELFELIGDGPVAAASIGQVYKAKLKATGDVVAIKIQRPNCEETIALDLYILRWWSGIANVITQGILKRDVNVVSIIDDFGELIYREIDYVAEAANAQRFNEIYASLIDTVRVPKVISALTTSKVLVMEWVDGAR